MLAVLPALECPFPASVNPHAAEVHQGTLRWVQRFGFAADARSLQRVKATAIGWLAARFHPNAPYEALQLVSDWYIWMFFRDDERDDTPLGKDPLALHAANYHFLTIFHGSQPPANDAPLAWALWDLRTRLQELVGSPVWLRRFGRAVQEHFDATVWEATNRLRGHVPDLESYIRVRPLTGGLYVDAALVEVAEGTRLPPDVQSHPVVQRLIQSSNNIVCWANDIISLEKEQQSGDVHNLVLVLQHAQQLSLTQATHQAIHMHNEEVCALQTLLTQLPTFGTLVDESLERFVATLQARVRGNLDWSLVAGRYTHKGVRVHYGDCEEGYA